MTECKRYSNYLWGMTVWSKEKVHQRKGLNYVGNKSLSRWVPVQFWAEEPNTTTDRLLFEKKTGEAISSELVWLKGPWAFVFHFFVRADSSLSRWWGWPIDSSSCRWVWRSWGSTGLWSGSGSCRWTKPSPLLQLWPAGPSSAPWGRQKCTVKILSVWG